MTCESMQRVAAQAATRLNLALGRDNIWRGRCPCCCYGKSTLAIKVANQGIAISCAACGEVAGIAAIAGIPSDILVAPEPAALKIARALKLWGKAASAVDTPVESYLRGRSITVPVPTTIRGLPRQRNWNNGRDYAAMIALVERLPEDGEGPEGILIPSGVHLTFLESHANAPSVQKAATESNKLSLGQLRHGGVWLKPIEQIGGDLAVAEGIETALSVMQITGLPTVATLSAAGMGTFKWPEQIRRLWIAADNDAAGMRAAETLLARVLRAGLQAEIKIPKGGKNDFNDLIMEN
jgi:putative DNA primase/helicase